MNLQNTNGNQDKEIKQAEEAAKVDHISNLVQIINDLDKQLTEAKEEIERLKNP